MVIAGRILSKCLHTIKMVMKKVPTEQKLYWDWVVRVHFCSCIMIKPAHIFFAPGMVCIFILKSWNKGSLIYYYIPPDGDCSTHSLYNFCSVYPHYPNLPKKIPFRLICSDLSLPQKKAPFSENPWTSMLTHIVIDLLLYPSRWRLQYSFPL